MSWLALVLIGLGVTDLAYSARRGLWLPPVVGAGAVLLAAALAGFTRWQDLAVTALVVAAVFGWAVVVTRGFGRGAAWEPLTFGALVVLAALVAAPWSGPVGGWWARWVSEGGTAFLGGVGPERLLLLVGAFLVQLSTGNVVVRLVLRATGSIHPAHNTPPRDVRVLEAPPHTLKGGRLLGPMERVFVLGLGLAGQFTAAGIVVAAKGLLRFPELTAARDDRAGPGIHAVTEYFLVGSFASWLVSLGTLVLVGGC